MIRNDAAAVLALHNVYDAVSPIAMPIFSAECVVLGRVIKAYATTLE